MNTTTTNKSVPIADKYALTVEEATAYFSIGQKKIRSLSEDFSDAGFTLHVGAKLLIKRKAFEAFLDNLETM